MRLDWRQQPPIPYIPPPEGSQQQTDKRSVETVQQPTKQQPIYQPPKTAQPQVDQPTADLQSTKKASITPKIILAIMGGGVLLLFGSFYMGTLAAKQSTTVPAPEPYVTPAPEITPAPAITPSSTGSYVGSINSDKFHKPSCQWAQKISKSNEIWFSSRQDAISKGYQACKVCNP